MADRRRRPRPDPGAGRARPTRRRDGQRRHEGRGADRGTGEGRDGSYRARSEDPRSELARRGGAGAERDHRRLMDAAEDFEHERYRDARRTLEPLRERYPDAASVIELLGLTLYRLGQYGKALKELERFVGLTDSTEQHPVLMDCYRASRSYEDVDRLWDELRDASPSGELVTEGRIVMAGALSDQGRLREALKLLQRGPVEPKRAKPHHLRLWYALADLEERAGNLPRARTLFEQVRQRDAGFADVAERLSALG